MARTQESEGPTELESLKRRLAAHKRNLLKLQEQRATYAAGEEPLHLLNQIEHEEREIEAIWAKLRQLNEALKVKAHKPEPPLSAPHSWWEIILEAPRWKIYAGCLTVVFVLVVLAVNVWLWKEQPDVIATVQAILRPTRAMETTSDVSTYTPTSHIPIRTPTSKQPSTAATPTVPTVDLGPSPTLPFVTMSLTPPPPTNTPMPPTPRPLKPTIYNFTADRYTITAGENVVLCWDLIGANVAYLRYNGIEEVVAPGNKTVSPANTTVYTLVARNNAGETAAQLTITVNPATPTLTLTVDVARRARVFFDEAHSEWTSITSNFLAFANDLRLQGYTVERHTDGPFTDDLLANFDVLVVGTAWGDFTVAELDSIQQFVASGGGLFITGLGWSWVNPNLGRTLDNYPMNRIATRFGLRFLDDAICDPTSHYSDDNDCTPTFSAMAVHPIASGLMVVGGPISPSSIEHLSGTAQAVIFGDADAYSNKGYYSASTNPPVVMAVEYGAGRVVALGHEAYLVTDDCNSDGTPERDNYDNAQLGRNIIDWLAEGAAE